MPRPKHFSSFFALGGTPSRSAALALALLAMASAGIPAFATPTASVLFAQMLSANSHYSYRGREAITYWNSGHTVAINVSHMAPRFRRLDYLSPVRREGLIFLSNGHEEWKYDPRTREVVHSPLVANAVTDPDADYRLLKANYRLSVTPQAQTVDNRKTFVLMISNEKTGHLSQKLWIDAATGVPLKEEWYGGLADDGGHERPRLTMTESFTTIDFHPRLEVQMFDPTLLTRRSVRVTADPVAEVPIPMGHVLRDYGRDWFIPAKLGAFRLMGAGMMRGPRLHLRYSDGLNQVSLFEKYRHNPRFPTVVPRSHPVRIGSLSTQVVALPAFTVITWDTPTRILSLLGEAPLTLRTLEQLVSDAAGHRQ